MCVLLGAFELLSHHTKGKYGMRLERTCRSCGLTTACTLGVLLAVRCVATSSSTRSCPTSTAIDRRDDHGARSAAHREAPRSSKRAQRVQGGDGRRDRVRPDHAGPRETPSSWTCSPGLHGPCDDRDHTITRPKASASPRAGSPAWPSIGPNSIVATTTAITASSSRT